MITGTVPGRSDAYSKPVSLETSVHSVMSAEYYSSNTELRFSV